MALKVSLILKTNIKMGAIAEKKVIKKKKTPNLNDVDKVVFTLPIRFKNWNNFVQNHYKVYFEFSGFAYNDKIDFVLDTLSDFTKVMNNDTKHLEKQTLMKTILTDLHAKVTLSGFGSDDWIDKEFESDLSKAIFSKAINHLHTVDFTIASLDRYNLEDIDPHVIKNGFSIVLHHVQEEYFEVPKADLF